jgi:hypothetical protein
MTFKGFRSTPGRMGRRRPPCVPLARAHACCSYRSTTITGVSESTGHSVRTIIMHSRGRQEDRMRATRIMANLRVPDVEAAKSFYTDYLGLSTEEFNLGWVARYTSPDARATSSS